MKNKILPSLVLLLAVVGCIYGIKTIINSEKTSETASPVSGNNITELRSRVYSGRLDRQVRFHGKSVNHNPNQYVIVSADIPKKTSSEIKCKVGDEVTAGQVLFTVGNKEYKSEVDGLLTVVGQEKNSLYVGILDYSQLFIDVSIDYEYLSRIPKESQLKVIIRNELTDDTVFHERVIGNAFSVNDNCIDIFLSNSNHYLPGMSFEIEYNYVDEISACYILRDMLMEDATGFYVYKKVNENRVRQEVVPGKEFSIKDEKGETVFIEILSGVCEGDELIVEFIEE
ncbi:MAG: hypothetical protein J5738_02805 [Lachnospiraceae bacterium]|nr:hypothetical protein [Lachnospiraceae bacterium]